MAKLPLHDIDDAERFVSAIAGRSGLTLSWDDRADLEQYLLVECWQLSLRYDGAQGSRFSSYARNLLQRRTVDWIRKRNGRTRWQFANGRVHERKRPELVSLDNSELDQLGSSQPDGALDDATDRQAFERGLHDSRSRPPAGYAAEVRKRLPRRVA